jgi:hypothetical protein
MNNCLLNETYKKNEGEKKCEMYKKAVMKALNSFPIVIFPLIFFLTESSRFQIDNSANYSIIFLNTCLPRRLCLWNIFKCYLFIYFTSPCMKKNINIETCVALLESGITFSHTRFQHPPLTHDDVDDKIFTHRTI